MTDMSVEVSIIIPVYNAAANIDKCVKSILKQSYKGFELILINDGSKDNSLEIIRKYEKKYKNVRVIDKPNEGVSKTRNLGIKEAAGKYVMFIDNDDYIDEDYVETLLNAIKREKVDCVYSGYRRENSKGEEISCRRLVDTKWSKYILSAPWAKIYKRKYLLDNKIKFLPYGIGEDVYFTQKLISSKAKIKIIDYVGYTWFFNDESVSNTSQRGMKESVDILYLLNKLKKFADFDDDLTKYFFYRYCVWYLLFSGRQATKAQFKGEYKRYAEWLKENGCCRTISPLSRKIKGESLKDRICVLVMRIVGRLHLVGLFASVYCKG